MTSHLLLKAVLFTALIHTAIANAANSELPTILVLGDSLSSGHGIERSQGWVTLLEQTINQAAPSRTTLPSSATTTPAYQVINASISGETTGGGLSRLPQLLVQHQPDIVIIELGANDGLRGFPITTLRNNLAQLIELSQQANARVLLIGMHIPPNYGSRYTQLFYDSYTLMAQKYPIDFVPFLLDGVAVHPELMQSDGLHPTAAAQPRILQNVMPYLKKIL